MKRRDLISDYMLEQNIGLHKRDFGGSSWRYAEVIVDWSRQIEANSVLDYGCGEATLRGPFFKLRTADWREYDPAIDGKDTLPEPADLVVCTDVLEHVEPEKLDNVIQHICDLSIKGAFLIIATRKANKILPNGDNAHAIVARGAWWLEKIRTYPWIVSDYQIKPRKEGGEKEIRLWIRKA